METFSTRYIKRMRKYRDVKLASLGKLFLRYKISPNVITAFSGLFAIGFIYYLFTSLWFVILFGVLHIIADSLDGVVARLSTSTTFGKYFDLSVDSLLTLGIIIKIGMYLNDVYAYIVAALFTLSVLIHFFTRFDAPIFFYRTIGLFVAVIGTIHMLPYKEEFLTLAYLLGGVFSAYSLALQVQWKLQKQ